MERHRARGIRRGSGLLLAVTAVSGLLLTGCSADSGSASDSSNDGRQHIGNPAPAAPTGGARKEDGESPSPRSDHLSTFALDVDTASYGYARSTLADGALPDPETVRPEEFVNSFHQDYARPDGDGFSVTVDGARTDKENWSLVRVGLATRAAESDAERPPVALTFVVDVSGSMGDPGRLDLAQKGLDKMTDRLRDDDSVAVVTFSDTARVALRMTRLKNNRGRVHQVIDDLAATYDTNLAAGVETGYATAVAGLREGATNRVVLVSDGLANTGDTDPDGILDRIDTARRENGITLFGVGVGHEYGDALMERLADKGDGHTAYVANETEATTVFARDLTRNIGLAARDAKAQVAFDPHTVVQFHLVGYDDRRVADDDFRDDSVDGGEVGPGHTVTALYAVRTRAGAHGHLATATVRWLDPATRAPHEESGQIETDALGSSLREAPTGLQVTAVAAYFADSLRFGDRRWTTLPGDPGLAGLATWSRQLAESTENTDLARLADAIVQAHELEG
ncbi:vWA domain-containing protein [Streptomyces mangrovisoli]|uniref:VWFA domain-containing protein n=1 Tax=Streptomyces mangrovisoli TaxID=1428628 RepID=A0A1J4NLL4_9ACTN|nr:von Willebrand factor type A domain-containing protein [Streptomyces mangrovisoli]OIJ62516.1 hypothetical protein WN71_039155 [Streptomyces mangrovisoli]